MVAGHDDVGHGLCAERGAQGLVRGRELAVPARCRWSGAIESDAEKGRVTSAVTIEPVSGELPSLALSSTYAARALKSASMISERAELAANVSTSPIVLTPTSLADKVVSARFVVVPMRS